jgi:hypothetical protein
MANSKNASEIGIPSMAKDVSLTEVKISGSNMGKERTGYNVPFDPALAIIAAINVEEIAMPILPSTNVKKNIK